MFIIIGGDGKEYGPVTVDQVRTWITAGRANLDTKAKALGSEEWRRLGDYPEFSGATLPPRLPAAGASAGPVNSGRLAGPGARTGAALINAFLYFLCTIPGSMMMSRKLLERNPELAQGGIPRLSDIDLTAVAAGMVWVWAGLLAGILLQSILLGVRGQNVGKMMVGIRVVRAEDSKPPGFVRGAVLRFLLPVTIMLALNLLPLGLGFVFLLVDYGFMFREDRRCLHDRMAKTITVTA